VVHTIGWKRVNHLSWKQWCKGQGCRGCKSTTKSFDLLKMRSKSLKIWAKSLNIQTKSLNISTKSLKIWAKMAPNVFRKTRVDHFLDATSKNGRHMLNNNFLGKFGKIWAKILCTSKICLLLHLCLKGKYGSQFTIYLMTPNPGRIQPVMLGGGDFGNIW